MNKTKLEKVKFLLDLSKNPNTIYQNRELLWKELNNITSNETVNLIKNERLLQLNKIHYENRWWNLSLKPSSEVWEKQKKQNLNSFYQLYAVNNRVLDLQSYEDGLLKMKRSNNFKVDNFVTTNKYYIEILGIYFRKYHNKNYDIYNKNSNTLQQSVVNQSKSFYFVEKEFIPTKMLINYLVEWFEKNSYPLFLNEFNFEYLQNRLKEVERYITKISILKYI